MFLEGIAKDFILLRLTEVLRFAIAFIIIDRFFVFKRSHELADS